MVAVAPSCAESETDFELRADVDALRVSSPEAMVELQRQLCLRSVCDPTPPAWSQFWFGSHPTVLERVALATVGSEARD